MKMLKNLLTLMRGFYLILFLAVINGTLGFVLSINMVLFASIYLASFLGLDINISLNLLASLIVFSGVLRGVLRYVEQYSNHYLAFKILQELRDKIFLKLVKVKYSFYEDSKKADILNMYEEDIENLEVFYAHTISPILIAILTSLSIFIFISLFVSIYVGFYFLFAYFVIGFVSFIIYYKFNRNLYKKKKEAISSFNNYYLDSIYGSFKIKSVNKEEDVINKINDNTNEINQLIEKVEKNNARFKNINNSIILILNLFSLFLSIFLIKLKVINCLETLIIFSTLISSYGSVINIFNLGDNLGNVVASAKRVLYLLEVDEDNDNGTIMIDDIETIEFKNVSFKYYDTYILKNFNLKLNKNDYLGILGNSGAGKSTMFKLLMKYYKVNSGTILINGININDINTQSLYENMTMFSQDSYLFNDTILYNLTFNDENISINRVNEVLKKVGLNDLIYSLKDGINTKISVLKNNFSEGEIKRLALARVLLKDVKVLLLDEFSSNIDVLNECEILKTLKDEKENLTIMIVSHKKSTLSICDNILEFGEVNYA